MESQIASLTAGMTPQQMQMAKLQNHNAEIYTCAIVFSALAVLAVAVRVTSRHMKNVVVGLDDILVLSALVNNHPLVS